MIAQSTTLPTRTMDRKAVIEWSLYAFVCGLLSLLPFVGIAPAILTLKASARVRARFGEDWNPASGYLHAGVAVALIGILQWLASLFLIAATVLLHLL